MFVFDVRSSRTETMNTNVEPGTWNLEPILGVVASLFKPALGWFAAISCRASRGEDRYAVGRSEFKINDSGRIAVQRSRSAP
jgi:hypothetical protein